MRQDTWRFADEGCQRCADNHVDVGVLCRSAWQIETAGIVGAGVGDLARRQDGTLYILDPEKRSLLKLEKLPRREEIPQETP